MNINDELEKFRQGTPEEIEKKLEEQKKKTLELARDAADIHCEGEEKPLASEIIADLNEHMEKLRNQREILRMQTDIINLVLKVNDYEYLKTLQNHVRVACNQQNKKQEA